MLRGYSLEEFIPALEVMLSGKMDRPLPIVREFSLDTAEYKTQFETEETNPNSEEICMLVQLQKFLGIVCRGLEDAMRALSTRTD